MTDDSEIVRLSDRVMAGRHSVTDQARREEIREEEGSLAALFFILGRYGEWGKKEKKKSQTVGVLLLDDEQAPILVDVFKRDKRLKVCSIMLH